MSVRRSTGPVVALVAMSLLFGFVGYGSSGPSGPVQAAPGQSVVPSTAPSSGRAAAPKAAASTVGVAPVAPARPGLECAPGRNGGATDTGVTATSIRLAATAVLDGPAASLLKLSPTGMKAVIDKVNARGGICGRRLELTIVNDSFDAQRGQQYIGNFIAGDHFALAVVPSAEGLSSAISAGDIERAGMPVVGTDGMRIEQYEDPWVWPVATATVSTMRIMAEYAFRERAARTFAIVWDGKYKFGVEGAEAFKRQVAALGGQLVTDVKLDPDQPSYASEVADFNATCGGGGCDMVALLLLPDTAKNWMSRNPVTGRAYNAGAQTLFTDQFAQSCVQAAGSACHGLAVWTGYNPPIDRFARLPDVARFVDDVTTVSPGIDVRNQFLEGAYLGMSLLVDAIERVGPDLTRERLRAALDSMRFETDLTSPLRWRPGDHRANLRARAFAIVVAEGTFKGWRDENTGWVADPSRR